MNLIIKNLNLNYFNYLSPFIIKSYYFNINNLNFLKIFSKNSFYSFIITKNFYSIFISFSRYLNYLQSPFIINKFEKIINITYKNSNNNCTFLNCKFEKCNSNKGGAIFTENSKNFILFCYFKSNIAKYSGSLYFLNSEFSIINYSIFFNNSAEYVGVLNFDCKSENNEIFSFLFNSNFTFNSAIKWTNTIRNDQGSCKIEFCDFFYGNSLNCGVIFDFSWDPSILYLNNNIFFNNSSLNKGSVLTLYHYMSISICNFNYFLNNFKNSIFIESIDTKIYLKNCFFSKSLNLEILTQFNISKIFIENNVKFNI